MVVLKSFIFSYCTYTLMTYQPVPKRLLGDGIGFDFRKLLFRFFSFLIYVNILDL